MTDATLSVIAARHEMLECLELGPDFCERISSDAIRAVAICCPRLRKLRLSGVREIDSDSIDALAKNCVNLCDVGFMDCLKVDESALGNMGSLRFLSVAGTSNWKWGLVSHLWSKLPNLVGLDVSRTDISPTAVSRMMLSCQSLKVLCALNSTNVEEDANFVTSSHGSKGKLLFSLLSDIFKGVSLLFVDNSMKGRNVFLDWRDTESKDQKWDDIMTWLEWVLLYSLLRIADLARMVRVLHAAQFDAEFTGGCSGRQERAATGLATFVVIDDENNSIDGQRAEAVMRGGGVQLYSAVFQRLFHRRQKDEYKVHAYNRGGLCALGFMDDPYPVRSAFSLLTQVLDEYQKAFGDSWKRVTSDSTQPWPYLNEALAKYQDPAEADKLLKIQRELDETKIILHKTIDSVLERGERLDSLVEKSSDLSAASQLFLALYIPSELS
uniref:Uncharacterized protein n=1 Tax=Chenopodium quinoa TaxID=63459 RepID=A0A803MZ66_CHEQI